MEPTENGMSEMGDEGDAGNSDNPGESSDHSPIASRENFGNGVSGSEIPVVDDERVGIIGGSGITGFYGAEDTLEVEFAEQSLALEAEQNLRPLSELQSNGFVASDEIGYSVYGEAAYGEEVDEEFAEDTGGESSQDKSDGDDDYGRRDDPGDDEIGQDGDDDGLEEREVNPGGNGDEEGDENGENDMDEGDSFDDDGDDNGEDDEDDEGIDDEDDDVEGFDEDGSEGFEVENGGIESGPPEPMYAGISYCERESCLQAEEDSGSIKFTCVSNDGVDQHMIWLIGLKNIFSRQLPNMPKVYIVRLVLDSQHKSMIIVKRNEVVGGITYRPYPSLQLGEIAFLAITATEQVRGYGTRLMNHLKQFARDKDGLTRFLTFADNNAVGYFQKQGFSKEITLEKEKWDGYIKEYEGGTLMECVLNPLLPYTDLPNVVKLQQEAVHSKIAEFSKFQNVYPAFEIEKNAVRAPTKPVRIEDIPGISDAHWTPEQSFLSKLRLVSVGPDFPPTRNQLHAFMRNLHKAVSERDESWPFLEPVDPTTVTDYYDVIKDPIDLGTILKRLESEAFYIHLDIFVADMMRMFSNAMKYNAPDTFYYKAAKKLEEVFLNRINAGVLIRTS